LWHARAVKNHKMSITLTDLEASHIELIAIPCIPLIQPGDDLPGVVLAAACAAGVAFCDRDVLVLAQKIVSKAEGRLVRLAEVTPSDRARELAAICKKDPRLVEVILGESNEVLRVRPGVIVVEHRLGFVCASAGVDQSNVHGDDEWALLLPADPDASAQQLRAAIYAAAGADVAVIIADSHGRAWRFGTVGVAIGVAGLHPVTDLRGRLDLAGRPLHITEVGTADEIAAAAGLLMGQAAEGTPVVLIRGAPFVEGEGRLAEVLRPREIDMFR
jgi:coenzyme F420-0:L-glutamate ligase/coenzyme F420-1:gamma-L-glutamate ligase